MKKLLLPILFLVNLIMIGHANAHDENIILMGEFDFQFKEKIFHGQVEITAPLAGPYSVYLYPDKKNKEKFCRFVVRVATSPQYTRRRNGMIEPYPTTCNFEDIGLVDGLYFPVIVYRFDSPEKLSGEIEFSSLKIKTLIKNLKLTGSMSH